MLQFMGSQRVRQDLDTEKQQQQKLTESRMALARARGSGDGELRLVDTEFQFGKMQKVLEMER